MSASAITPVPTQAEIEQRAREYRDLEIQMAEKLKAFSEEIAPLAVRKDELKKILIADVRQFGTAHAKKSKILYGYELEVMATFGKSSSIDNAAVESFRLGLKKAGQTRLLKKIFTETIRWDLRVEATKVIALAHEAGKLPNKLFVLFTRCTVTQDTSPRLEVRPRQKAA